MNNNQMSNKDKTELEKLIKQNYGLIVSQALSFNPKTNDQLDEYIQVGSLAMMRAIKNFDESKGAQFSTFACHCISNSIKNYIKKNNKIVEQELIETEAKQRQNFMELVPDNLADIELEIIELKLSNHSIKEISDKIGYPVIKVRNILYKIYEKIRNANEENITG